MRGSEDLRQKEMQNRRREDAKKQTARRRKQKKARRALKIWIGILVTLSLVGAALCLTVLFPIQEIRVTGQTQYTEEQILSASGLELSQNLFTFSQRNVAEQIEKQLPYVESVQIKRILPGTVRIQVFHAEETYAYKVENTYYVTNAKGKVLRQSVEAVADTTEVVGVAQAGAVVGEYLPFNDQNALQLMNELTEKIGNYSLKLTKMDLSSSVNIVVVLEDRIRVELGTQTDLIYKISHMAETVKTIGSNSTGTLDLSEWSREKPQGYFREGEINENLSK